MKVKLVGTILTVGAASTMIAACSGGSGGGASSGDGFGSTITAQFIDAPVKGLPFKNSTGTSSLTGAAGKFSCKRGEMIKFNFNDLDLGFAPCDSKIFIQDLISGTDNKSLAWDQAAAVIQSFALTNSGELDLSSVDLTKIDTTSLTNSSDFSNNTALSGILGSSTGAYPEGTTLPTAKTIAEATSHANNSLTEYNKLDRDFEEALTSMANEDFLLKGTLTSGDRKFCYNHLAAQAYVDDKGDGYSFNIVSAAGSSHSELFVVQKDKDIACLSHDDTKLCAPIPSHRLPRPKIITGLKTEMMFHNTTDIMVENQTLDVLETNNLSLTAAVKAGVVTAKGSFIINQVVLSEGDYKGHTNKCVYQMESAAITN